MLHVERVWLHGLDQFCSQLQVLPWTPHLGKIFKKYPRAFFSLGFGRPPKSLTPSHPSVVGCHCWLSLTFPVIGASSVLLVIIVVVFSLLLVIINVVGYHRCFLLLTYPVVGDHSLKLEKPLLALLLHKLHQTCLFHAIAVDISWNEKK